MLNKSHIGIIGRGFVGSATGLLFQNANIRFYDKEPSLCEPIGLTLSDMLDECKFIFICVPTPMNKDGSCCLKIIDSVYQDLQEAGLEKKGNIVILRSTVPPGTADKYGFCFMPEFLTEANWRNDTLNTKKIYLGLSNDLLEASQNTRYDIQTELNEARLGHHDNDSIILGKTRQFELYKIFCNSFLATKVAFCNEFFNYCKSMSNFSSENTEKSVYDELVTLLGNDIRIGETHLNVPGPDGRFGFGGTCFPKDIHSLEYEMENNGVKHPVISSVIKRNEEIDRPEKDWMKDKGRATV